MAKDNLDASKYPDVYRKLLEEELELARNFVLGSKNVIDVGCGNGRAAGALISATEHYVGIDSNPDFINKAKSLHGNAEFHCIDACSMSGVFGPRHFQSAVALWNTIACVKDDVECIKQVSKIVDGGFFFTVNMKGSLPVRKEYYNNLGIEHSIDEDTETIFSDEWGQTRAYSIDDIHKIVTSSGFLVSEIRPLHNVLYAVFLKKSTPALPAGL